MIFPGEVRGGEGSGVPGFAFGGAEELLTEEGGDGEGWRGGGEVCGVEVRSGRVGAFEVRGVDGCGVPGLAGGGSGTLGPEREDEPVMGTSLKCSARRKLWLNP